LNGGERPRGADITIVTERGSDGKVSRQVPRFLSDRAVAAGP